MKSKFYLPPMSQPARVTAALQYHRTSNLAEFQRRAVEWTRSHWFVQGVRNLRVLVPGALGGDAPAQSFVDSSGQRHVRIELALQMLQTEIGRLLGVDLAPAADQPRGISLDGARGTAIAQTLLDNFWQRFRSGDFRQALVYGLVTYGTMGVLAHDVGPAAGIFGASLRLIPPWELMPLPAAVTTVEEVAGTTWRTFVPYQWLRDTYGDLLKWPKDKGKLHLEEVPAGARLQTQYSPLGGSYPAQSAEFSRNMFDVKSDWKDKSSPTKDAVEYVEMNQSWTHSDDGSCTRWLVLLGEHLAADRDYEEEPPAPICPIGVARYLSVGSFWGRGLVDRLAPLNREIERLTGDLIQSQRDSDRLRMLAIPTSIGINMGNLKQYMRNRILPYSPDLSAPAHMPQILSPPALGDTGGKTIGLLSGFLQALASQGEMFQGGVPGRLDSADSLSVLAEHQQVPLTPAAESIESCLGQVYKALLGIFRRRLPEGEVLDLLRLDESMLGVTYDPQAGGIQVNRSHIPDPHKVRITIRNKLPRNKEAVKERLDGQLERGLLSKTQYNIAIWKEGLDVPTVDRAAYENYVSAWLESLIMFGDGQTPGQPLTNEFADNHPIHLMVHMGVMASPLFRRASPPVRDAFVEHTEGYHKLHLGAIPLGLESVDDLGNVGPPGPGAMEGLMAAGGPQPGQSPPMETLTQ